MDSKQVSSLVEQEYKASVVECLHEYIKIPNQSPLFDPEWNTNGLLGKAVTLLTDWVKTQNVNGLSMRVEKEADRTPLIFITVEGSNDTDETVLLYGHLDKQPPMTEFWDAGLGPFTPVMRDGKLYGRGGADDGYSIFAAVLGIKALQRQGVDHARCVIVIEACEESGSPDLPFYINKLAPEIRTPSLIICLDSGCGNYDQLWCTTSLRGIMVGTLTVKLLTEGVHSGASSGVVPSTARIARQLLDRLEDSKTGKMIPECYVEIPAKHQQYAKDTANTLGPLVYSEFPFLPGGQPVSMDTTELVLNKTWRPTLCVTGVGGIPALAQAGNVLRPVTQFKLSIRLPPTLEPAGPSAAVKRVLEADPPYGAQVTFVEEKSGAGWMAPPMDAWLEESVQHASNQFFGRPAKYLGEGGSIPFMGMLGKMFPKAQFVITGVLGPKSNAHGPNEFLHMGMAKGVTCCVAGILADHYKVKCSKIKKRRTA